MGTGSFEGKPEIQLGVGQALDRHGDRFFGQAITPFCFQEMRQQMGHIVVVIDDDEAGDFRVVIEPGLDFQSASGAKHGGAADPASFHLRAELGPQIVQHLREAAPGGGKDQLRPAGEENLPDHGTFRGLDSQHALWGVLPRGRAIQDAVDVKEEGRRGIYGPWRCGGGVTGSGQSFGCARVRGRLGTKGRKTMVQGILTQFRYCRSCRLR